MNKNLIYLAFSGLLLSSCASMIRGSRCNVSYAEREALDDLEAGATNKPGLLKSLVCQEAKNFSPENYAAAYNAAWTRALPGHCSIDKIRAYAREDAGRKDFNETVLTRFNACVGNPAFNRSRFQRQYDGVFKDHFCSTVEIEKSAEEAALAWGEIPAINEAYQRCGAAKIARIRSSRNQAYKRVMKKQCNIIQVSKMGIKHARKGIPFNKGLDKLKFCPARSQADLLREYRKSYQMESRSSAVEIIVVEEKSSCWKDFPILFRPVIGAVERKKGV